MSYRTIKIDWLPTSGAQWKTFTAARLEAGRLWAWLVERHADVRQQGGMWPTKADLQKEIKQQFPDLHSQSAQQIVADFCAAIASAEALRTHAEPYEYPHKKPRYRQVIFTNQGAKYRGGTLMLPCGKAGHLSVRILLSIPATSWVVVRTPRKSLGSHPEKPLPFRASGVSLRQCA